MGGIFWHAARVLVMAASLGATSLGAGAADLGAMPQDGASVPADPALVEASLSNYLDLLMIRSTFDVLGEDQIEPQLLAQAAAWGAKGPNPQQLAAVESSLLGEAGYYITSIRYTVEAGGAIFPPDRSESVYTNDTLVQLTALQDRLVDAIEAHATIHPIMLEAQRLLKLTNGEVAVPPGEDRFRRHSELLARALARLATGVPT